MPSVDFGSQEKSTMIPQLIPSANDTVDIELDQLTYSAYLLTLDPDVARSVAMAAIETSMDDPASHGDLLRRTIEISLVQSRPDGSAALDRKSLAFEALLYSDSGYAMSNVALFLKKYTDGNPILLLDSGARIAFVLHHVLGYSISGAAAMAHISEKEYRTQLRNAYLQLASPEVGPHAIADKVLGQAALA